MQEVKIKNIIKFYRNKETGEIVEGVFVKWFNKSYKFIPNSGVPLIFLTKRHFKSCYELINDNEK